MTTSDQGRCWRSEPYGSLQEARRTRICTDWPRPEPDETITLLECQVVVRLLLAKRPNFFLQEVLHYGLFKRHACDRRGSLQRRSSSSVKHGLRRCPHPAGGGWRRRGGTKRSIPGGSTGSCRGAPAPPARTDSGCPDSPVLRPSPRGTRTGRTDAWPKVAKTPSRPRCLPLARRRPSTATGASGFLGHRTKSNMCSTRTYATLAHRAFRRVPRRAAALCSRSGHRAAPSSIGLPAGRRTEPGVRASRCRNREGTSTRVPRTRSLCKAQGMVAGTKAYPACHIHSVRGRRRPVSSERPEHT